MPKLATPNPGLSNLALPLLTTACPGHTTIPTMLASPRELGSTLRGELPEIRQAKRAQFIAKFTQIDCQNLY